MVKYIIRLFKFSVKESYTNKSLEELRKIEQKHLDSISDWAGCYNIAIFSDRPNPKSGSGNLRRERLMSRFRIEIKDSIIRQPIRRYIPPETLGVQFVIDFSKCDPKNLKTVEYLQTIIPSEKNIVATNAVSVWLVIKKELDLKLYNPTKYVAEYLTNNPTPFGVQKKEIMRNEDND